MQGFILSQHSRDFQGRTQLLFHGRLENGHRFRWLVTEPRLVFFISRIEKWTPPMAARKALPLRDMRGKEVDALYFSSQNSLAKARQACLEKNIPVYEADIGPTARHLMEHGIKAFVEFISAPDSELTSKESDTRIFQYTNPKVKSGFFDYNPILFSLDLECAPNQMLYSAAWSCGNSHTKSSVARSEAEDNENVVVALAPEFKGPVNNFIPVSHEKDLIIQILKAIENLDPDFIIGWNIAGFDLRLLRDRCKLQHIPCELGTESGTEILDPVKGEGAMRSTTLCRIPGRSVLDGPQMLRGLPERFEEYSLEAISQTLLGHGKLIHSTGLDKVSEITRQWREDPEALARYNLVDAQLALQIFRIKGLCELAIRKALLTGLSVDRMGASVAALDFLYLPRLHRKGFVADTNPLPWNGENAPGGMVLEGEPGFFNYVAVFDFRSLYPSVIRTFFIDPLAKDGVLYDFDLLEDKNDKLSEKAAVYKKVQGPAGVAFKPSLAILPGIVTELLSERARARELGDEALSQAVKILMNSFYGVLGNSGCRFFDPRLSSSITLIGQWILVTTRNMAKDRNLRVLYGDTDSLFVQLPPSKNAKTSRKDEAIKLASELNLELSQKIEKEFFVQSHLELRFDKLFSQFHMPALRGEERGSKKRYAGILESDEMYIAGLEAMRSDWTEAAQLFQRALLAKSFECMYLDGVSNANPHLKSTEILGGLCREWNQRLKSGELDSQLVYRKALHKPLSDYQHNIPPHVRAARAANFQSKIVYYLMTLQGPVAIPSLHLSPTDSAWPKAPLNKEHYAEHQFAPIADQILRFFGLSWAGEVGGLAEGAQLSFL